MSMNLSITLPLNVIQKIQLAPDEATSDPEITKACTTAALSAVKQLPYKLQAQDNAPRPSLPALPDSDKQSTTNGSDESPINVTIVSSWSKKRYEFRDYPSTTICYLRDYMEEQTGVPAYNLRFVRSGKLFHIHMTLESVSVETILAKTPC